MHAIEAVRDVMKDIVADDVKSNMEDPAGSSPHRVITASNAIQIESKPRGGDAWFRRSLVPPPTPAILTLIGLASGWLYFWGGDLHRFTQWITAYIALFIGQFALYLLACYAVLRRSSTHRSVSVAGLVVVIAFATLFRAELAGRRPFLSTDAYRYVWDGRVQSAGINPYRYIPSAPELSWLRETEIYPRINRSDYEPTPYPPFAQAVYFGVYLVKPLSITAFKTAMSLFDLLSTLLIMLLLLKLKMDPSRAVVFAWHPLLIWEGAHSGHIESVFIAMIALALLARSHKKPVITGVALGLAALVKFYPALLVPAFLFSQDEADDRGTKQSRDLLGNLRRVVFSKPNLRMLAAFVGTIILVYLPYLTVGLGVVGSLPAEFKEEGYTSGGSRYFALELLRLLVSVPTLVFTGFAALVLVLGAAWLLTHRKRGTVETAAGMLGLIGGFLLLTTPRYPWYYAWLVPFLCFLPSAGWLYLTGATVLLYLVWFTPNVYPNLPIWLGVAIYGPTLVMLIRERRRSSAQVTA